MSKSRREFLVQGGRLASAAWLAPVAVGHASRARSHASAPRQPWSRLFEISLAQWSLHRRLRAGELEALEFPAFARSEFEIDAVEYVNQFFADRAADFTWLGELRTRAEDAGVQNLLIMIDGEGALAAADEAARRRAVERHFKWIAAARFLGCHAIRVNAAGEGDWAADRDRAADSLRRLAQFGADYDISVIVENHGGLSSNGEWLAEVMRDAEHPGVGTLPDFGNFHLGDGEWYDRYDGVRRLMPFAKAVSAKSQEFDHEGQEVRTDYRRMLRIVVEAGYRGYVGIEWEGAEPDEVEGVHLTKRLLERVRLALEPEFADDDR